MHYFPLPVHPTFPLPGLPLGASAMAPRDQQGCIRGLLPLRRLRSCVERSKRQPRCRTRARDTPSRLAIDPPCFTVYMPLFASKNPMPSASELTNSCCKSKGAATASPNKSRNLNGTLHPQSYSSDEQRDFNEALTRTPQWPTIRIPSRRCRIRNVRRVNPHTFVGCPD
jgi:hypothetical protein